MPNSILINATTCRAIKKTKRLEQAEYWRLLLLPNTDYYIADEKSKKHLSVFSAIELSHLYHSLSGQFANPSTEYKVLLADVQKLFQEMELDETPLKELKKLAKGKEPKDGPSGGAATAKPDTFAESDADVKKAAKKKPPKAAADGEIKRPKEGTATAKCWDVYDEFRGHGEEVERAVYVAGAVERGLNKATASTQYSKWLKTINLT